MSKEKDKCYGCTEREVGCHSTCKWYIKKHEADLKRYEQNRLNYHIKDAYKERVR